MTANNLRERRYQNLVGPAVHRPERPVAPLPTPRVIQAISSSEQAPRQMRMEAVPLNRMFVPAEYQRDFSQSWAKYIAKNYDPSLMRPLELAERDDGTYAIVDGQHRFQGLRIRFGESSAEPIWCHVSKFDSIEQEARWFLAHNAYIKKSNDRSNFNALEAGGDERARRLREIVERHGFSLHTKAGVAGVRSITPPALQVILRSYGLERWDIIEDTMTVIATILPEGEKITSLVVSGVGSFIAAYGSNPLYRKQRLIESLLRCSMVEIDRDSRAIRQIFKGSELPASRRAILNRYNRNLPPQTRLPEL